MAEYIEREALLAAFAMSEYPWTDFEDAWGIVQNAPAANVAPVVHGAWESPSFVDPEDELDPRVECSVCGAVEAAFARWKFCPNCGAKMDKED